MERESKTLTIDRLTDQYDFQKWGKMAKLSSSDSVFLASESRRENSKRSGKSEKDGRAKDSNSCRAQDGNSDKGSNSETSSNSSDANWSVCKQTGHEWYKCSKRVSSISRETEHDQNTCPTVVEEDANLALS